MRLLEQKFGPLDSARITQLNRADAEQLERWADRLLIAQTVEELFSDAQ